METRERRIFEALDTKGTNQLTANDLLAVLEDAGFDRKDPRMMELYDSLDALKQSAASIDFEQFVDLLGSGGLLVTRAITSALAIPDFRDFSNRLIEMFEAVKENRSGQKADYIPPLAQVDAEQFGVSVVSVDGQVFSTW